MPQTASLPFDRLVDFVAALFSAAGCDAEEARAVGFGLAEANSSVTIPHGVLRVPIYLGHLEAGIVRRGARPSWSRTTARWRPSTGARASGRSPATSSPRLGWQGAKETGAATVALRNVGHLGRIGRTPSGRPRRVGFAAFR